jgi:hypothetical protein
MACSHGSLILLINDDFPAVHFDVVAWSRLLDVNVLAIWILQNIVRCYKTHE